MTPVPPEAAIAVSHGGASVSASAKNPPLAEWLIFLVVLAWIWPRRIVMRSDDFGYYESVVATIRQGVAATSDWLEPFNLVLPSIAAGLWRLTGSFYFSTLGLIAFLAVVNFVLLWRWLRPMLPQGWGGNFTVLGVALFPVWLNKTVEFTGVPLGFTCFLGALLAWRARMCARFFVCVMIGFLNRQSAVCLLALPLLELFLRWRRNQRLGRDWVIGLLLSAVFVCVVVFSIPASFARELAAQRRGTLSFAHLAFQALIGAGLIAGLAAGWALLRGQIRFDFRPVLARQWPTMGWLALGVVVASSSIVPLSCETAGFARFAWSIPIAIVAVAAVAPRAWARVPPEALAVAGIYAALIAWRGVWWDYYLCELALILACSRGDPPGAANRRASTIFAIALVVFALIGSQPIRQQLDWAETRTLAYERALRSGHIKITQASEAPFGFLGWKLFPALQASGRSTARRLSDFLKYVEAQRSFYFNGQIAVKASKSSVGSIGAPDELWELPSDYQPRLMPLSDAEWQKWLQDPSNSSGGTRLP